MVQPSSPLRFTPGYEPIVLYSATPHSAPRFSQPSTSSRPKCQLSLGCFFSRGDCYLERGFCYWHNASTETTPTVISTCCILHKYVFNAILTCTRANFDQFSKGVRIMDYRQFHPSIRLRAIPSSTSRQLSVKTAGSNMGILQTTFFSRRLHLYYM